MKSPYASAADRLWHAGFREAEPGCFKSSVAQRVIGLAVCDRDPDAWHERTEELLRMQTMRSAPAWARCVVLLVEGRKTSPLSWAAASFGQEVSKCRRLVLFVDQNASKPVQLPFIGLPPLNDSIDAPPHDIEGVVRNVLSTSLADAFLNEDLAIARVQALAEEEEL